MDLSIVLAFAAYAVASGLRARAVASEDLTQYFLAGRSLGGVQAGLSMAATQFAADTPLLVTGLIATGGIFGLWRLWIYGIAFLLLGYVLAPSWRRAGVLTDAELSEARYGDRGAVALRAVKAVYFGLVFNCAVLAMVLFAATRIAEPFLVWHAWLPEAVIAPIADSLEALNVPLSSAPPPERYLRSADNALSLAAILFVTAFYSTTGGLRSVVRTDMVQLALALGGTALYAWYAVQAAGGAERMIERLPSALAQHPHGLTLGELLAFTPDRAPDLSFALLALLGLQWLVQMNADGTGYLAQRCMACRTDRDATRATLVFAWTQVFVRSLLWLPIGLALLVLFAPSGELSGAAFTSDREASYVKGMVELLPMGARGVLLAAMLAALASTLDTHLNWGASYLANDLYRRMYCNLARGREPEARELVRVARFSNALIVAIALVVMTQLGSVQHAWKITLLLGAGMGVMLLLRWLWWRVTALGELACIATASVAAPVAIAFIPEAHEAARLLSVAVVSTCAGIAVSLAWPARADAQVVARFYSRARPPGVWGPVAAGLGEPQGAAGTRLLHGLGRTSAASLSLFCALVGVGSWLVGGSAPHWFVAFVAPELWPLAMIAVAAGLMPLWLRGKDHTSKTVS